MSERFFLAPRALSQKPTPELEGLVRSRIPHFLESNSFGLCHNGPLNFIGALLVYLNREEFVSIVEKHKLTPSSEIREPIELHAKSILHDEKIELGTTLFKKTCGGMHVGLTLNGPINGIIVSEKINTPEVPPHVYPIRVYNDEAIPEDETKYRPYSPLWTMEQGLDPAPWEISPLGLNIGELNRMFKSKYYDLVKETRADVGRLTISTRDLLFQMCKRAGISVDTDTFFYTVQPSPEKLSGTK